MKNHYNGHRANKKRFEASLKPEEAELVDSARSRLIARGGAVRLNNKELLLELCKAL